MRTFSPHEKKQFSMYSFTHGRLVIPDLYDLVTLNTQGEFNYIEPLSFKKDVNNHKIGSYDLSISEAIQYLKKYKFKNLKLF